MKQTKLIVAGIIFLCLVFPKSVTAQFIKGADISWQTEMIGAGYKWYDDNGTQRSLHDILKLHSMNAIRLRVWVNPAGGWNNQSDVVTKAVWAKNAGMDVMIDFHYSDTWADPGNQTPPSAWSSYNVNQMMNAVWNHTVAVLTAVKNAGVTPKWVQIGNETNDGMLWPLGKASTNGFQNYAWFVNTGNNAAKSVFPSIKTIVHLANGDNRTVLQWNLDGLRAQGATYDYIGLSLYPGSSWNSKVNAYASNLNYLKSRYGKSIILCEVGMPASPASTAYNALVDILNKTKSNGGLGVFYWEPAGYNDWKGYSLHCWQSNGRPTTALDAFINGGNRASLPAENLEVKVDVFPNPFTSHLNVVLPPVEDALEASVSFLDTSGRVVFSEALKTGEVNLIKLDRLSQGLYVAKIFDGITYSSHTVIKK